jgi:glycine oxidase
VPGSDVVVIGAGAVGLACARRLAAAGRRVVVLEREPAGGQASRTAAGMLVPRVEASAPGTFFRFALRARDAFADFAAALEEESGARVDYRRDGLLAVPADEEEETELARRFEWQRAAGLPVEELTRSGAASRWPGLDLPPPWSGDEAPEFAEGRVFFLEDEAQVDGERVVEALLEACRRGGVDVRRGAAARGLRVEAGRVRAVRAGAEWIACEVVVNAAGAWAGAVAGWAGETVPVEPVRGELLAYATELSPPHPVITSGEAYGLLRGDGRFVVGATVARDGWEGAVTDAGQAWLEERAPGVRPDLARRRPAERRAGLRPGTPDHLPVIGFSRETQGLFHASGLYRNGILLAAATAELTARALAGDPRVEADLEPFSPARFAVAAETRA